MKVKCEHCGSYIQDTADKCPNCGATNEHMMRSAQGVPKTIEELRQFCEARELPLHKMRFFIGEDCKEARAFGIYRDVTGNVVVYKNKADGSRAVRYQGNDEAYAVNELYQKLKSEVLQRRAASSPAGKKARQKRRTIRLAVVLVIALLAAACVLAIFAIPDRGYYEYQGDLYYNSFDSWYVFDTARESWQPSEPSGELTGHYGDYWQGTEYDGADAAEDFANSEYYVAPSEDSSANAEDDWDSGDWDYDFGSWDSGDTNWDSDW